MKDIYFDCFLCCRLSNLVFAAELDSFVITVWI
jgi:hypothetical protein